MGIGVEAKENIGFLCIDEATPQGIQKTPIGSCFFVAVFNHNRSAACCYLVTAKHVYDDYVRRNIPLYVRLNKGTIKAGESGVEYLLLSSTWYSHPDPNVDLGVQPFGPQTDKDALYRAIAVDQLIVTPEILKQKGVTWPPGETEEVVIVAMMYQYHGQERNFPVVRVGRMALVTTELIEGEYGPSNYYLIESQIYHGNSGAPVYAAFPTETPHQSQLVLLGILVAGFPEKQLEIVRHQQLGPSETIGYYNLGISFVVPIEKLVELLATEEMNNMRKRGEPQPIRPISLKRPHLEKAAPIDKQTFETVLKKVSRKTSESES